MNKTVTINISGIIFHIEEDAYDQLSKYLSTIKGYFSKTDGGNEIMSDIEARIAELLQARINVSKQVILMQDVEHVMNVMGKPEDFGAEQSKEENSTEQERERVDYRAEEKIRRRLFRNPDEKALGGVCSGLAAYFDIDTVWVRLAMFLLIFFGGLSLWVYIILWIVIPEARTTADKLAMRGEEANINSIFKTFKDEAEDLKNRSKRQYDDVSRTVRDNLSQARSSGAEALNTFFNILGRLVGLFLICMGAVLLFAYAAGLFGISVMSSHNELMHWRGMMFESSSNYFLGVLAFIIVAGIPVLGCIYAGVKLLFKIRYHNRWLNLSLGILWAIGCIIGVYVGVSTAKEFGDGSTVKETVALRNTGDTIVIRMNPIANIVKSMKFDNNDDIESHFTRTNGDYFIGESNGHLSLIGNAELDVIESTSDSVELTIARISRGGSKQEANRNARSIEYAYRQDSNVFTFDQVFTAGEGTKFRSQKVNIKLKIPKGKVVYFDKSTKYLLHDIENTTNTWDGHMIMRRWKMTERGLECIDCKGLEDNSEERIRRKHSRHGDDQVIIDDDGIKVNGEDAEIKIDEDGIRITTPEKEIELKNDHETEKKKDSAKS